jgi:hypothetical protein
MKSKESKIRLPALERSGPKYNMVYSLRNVKQALLDEKSIILKKDIFGTRTRQGQQINKKIKGLDILAISTLNQTLKA